MAFEFLFIRAHLQLSDLNWKMSKSEKYVLVVLIIYCSLACLAMSESCTFDDCGSYKDHYESAASDYLWGNSLIRSGIDELCQNSKLFCFPSTLYGLFLDEHNPQTINLDVSRDGVEVVLSGIGNRNSSWSEDSGLFELSNGRTVSCSLHSGEQSANDGNPDHEFSFSCDGLKNAEIQIPESLHGSYPCVQISHYQLNWGQCNLYHPSVTSLSIKNTCNEIALIVYEPFSTDSQFYPCNFSEVQLGPGEAVTLSLVFLPTKLGLSSAQFIVQTSSGGFLVQAKGFGLESPYRIMPMEEFDVSSSGWWRKSISLFNPFDEAIQLEGVIVWVSVFAGNSSLLAKAICREEGHDRPGFSNVRKCLDVRTGYGFPKMTLRPLSNWIIGPQGTGDIMDIAFRPNDDGKIFGTVCLQLRRTLLNETETLLVPLGGELFWKPTYTDLVSASIEAVGIDEATRAVVFSVYVTNSASDLLKIVKITDVLENGMSLQIKYSEGLLLFPGSVTQVAVVMVQPLNVEYDNNHCRISILTNSSFTPQLDIPCQDFFQIFPRQSLEPYFHHQLHENVDIELPSYFRRSKMSSSAVQMPGKAAADEYVLKNSRNQGCLTAVCESKVVFPVVPVGGHLSKLITVKNPSPEPVALQLIMMNSGAKVDNCSIPDDDLRQFSSFNVLHNDSDGPIAHGFSIGKNAVTEAFLHPYGSVALGPVVFRPSSQCEWMSPVLIWNNLSTVECLSLLGSGGSLSLLLHEGSELMTKIDFDLNLTVPLKMSPPNTALSSEDTFRGCDKPFLKELLLTNNGDLPISVTGIYVSGSECQLDGFVVHNCTGFSLEAGESTKLVVSYQTDFTSSVVERDLELTLASSSRLVIQMKATVPVFMLNSCRKSVFSFWVTRSSIASFLAVLLVFGTMCFLMYNGTASGSLNESTDGEKKSVSTVDHSRKNSNPDFPSRSADGNERPVVIGSDIKAESVTVVGSQPRLVKPGTHETVSLTVRTGNDKRKRRRKRNGGGLAGLAAEGASSHSGASTPRSPLSPALTLTPKKYPSRSFSPSSPLGSNQLAAEGASSHSGASTPRSPRSPALTLTPKEYPSRSSSPSSPLGSHQLAAEGASSHSGASTPPSPRSPALTSTPSPSSSLGSHQRKRSPEIQTGPKKTILEPEVSMKDSSSSNQVVPLQEQAETKKSENVGPKVKLGQLATFPSMERSWPTPPMIARPPMIAPHVRAPGPRRKSWVDDDKYRYDIWGKHFSGIHLADKSNDVPNLVENDSNSFFVKLPHSLVTTNSECRSVSPSDQGG